MCLKFLGWPVHVSLGPPAQACNGRVAPLSRPTSCVPSRGDRPDHLVIPFFSGADAVYRHGVLVTPNLHGGRFQDFTKFPFSPLEGDMYAVEGHHLGGYDLRQA